MRFRVADLAVDTLVLGYCSQGAGAAMLASGGQEHEV
jgi:hypothetical protein